MFLASNICWVSSGTLMARYDWLPRAVSGANPGMKKWSRGNGTMLTASLRRSAFSCPGNRRHVVTPDMVNDTRWLRSPYVGLVSFSVLKHMSYSASLSIRYDSSVFSTSWCTDSVALYGSTTVSETFGDGITEYVFIIRSGYSSRIFDISSVPSPEPVPPPSECANWNPCVQQTTL
ncbi:Uncharacterized protein FWK35_00004167 [Aphis craccivora]|uniref:Uncharacterized protein n=1 Tax=Aphis craccivora TaxID=307492 RepID=A0A6G0ZDF6_APHCR|nr:Uncharacterized protein FWK35_00004167 [Aphis craccivora]